jgi:hypothetical protein
MRTKGEMNQCTAAKPGGERCEAVCRQGTDHCSFHTPEFGALMRDARVAGGSARAKPAAAVGADVPDVEIATAAQIVALLGDTINRVRRGGLDPKIANAVGYLAAIALRGIEVGGLEERLAHIESVVCSAGAEPGGGLFGKRISAQQALGRKAE